MTDDDWDDPEEMCDACHHVYGDNYCYDMKCPAMFEEEEDW